MFPYYTSSLQKLLLSVTFLDHYIFPLFKVWDTRSNYKCIKTLNEHTGMVLALCTHRLVVSNFFPSFYDIRWARILFKSKDNISVDSQMF